MSNLSYIVQSVMASYHLPSHRKSTRTLVACTSSKQFRFNTNMTSFDEYLDNGCPLGVDWDLQAARKLTVLDVRDWIPLGEARDPLLALCEECQTMNSKYYSAVNARLPPPFTSEELEAKWEELRPKLYEACGRKFEWLPRHIRRSEDEYLIGILPRTLKQQRKTELDARVLERRTKLWRMVLAQSSGPLDPTVFSTASTNSQDWTSKDLYILTPSGPSKHTIPLQQTHTSRFALPHHIADTVLHHTSSPESLLSQLNELFGTEVDLDADLGTWLKDGIAKSWDLGMLYGYLRPWWFLGLRFADVLERMKSREQAVAAEEPTIWDDGKLRGYINTAPRRVWDLYSNRVLPFHAVAPDSENDIFPSNVWAVSHVWVPETERHNVWTSVNGKEWPVPIPVDTTLDHIRIELLNMGAEYVFLDVLCLRQQGAPAMEEVRQKEWEVDVPVLRTIYRHDIYQTTIVYFNGVGLPFDISPAQLNSEFHWFNRAWTLQESPINWLPGGLTAELPGRSNGANFMEAMRISQGIVDPANAFMVSLIAAVQSRPGFAQKKPIDRAAAFAYLYAADTVPCYSEGTSAEELWRGALDSENGGPGLLDLLVRCPAVDELGWVPNWEDAMASCAAGRCPPQPAIPYDISEHLSFFPDDNQYYHDVFVLDQAHTLTPDDLRDRRIAIMPQDGSPFYINIFGNLSSGDELTLVGLAGMELWILGKNVSEANPDGRERRGFKKLAVGWMNDVRDRERFHELRDDLGRVQTVVYTESIPMK